MLTVSVETIGDMAVVECKGRIVRSDVGLKLRNAVTSQLNVRIVVLDLTEVPAIERGGLGTLEFLQRWTQDHDIQLKLFNPIASVKQRLEHKKSTCRFDIARFEEMVALLMRADSQYRVAA